MIPRLAGPSRAAALLLSGVWAGALLAFAAGAGIVLSTSPSRNAGGEVNRALLDALDVASYVLSGLLLLAVLVLSRDEETPARSRGLLPRLVLFGVAVTLASHLFVTPAMSSLRDRMPVDLELVPKDDPARRAWGRLHGVSSLALLCRVAASLGVFALALPVRPRPRWGAARPLGGEDSPEGGDA